MTGTLSALIGGGGVPVGAAIQALDAPPNFVSGAAEYLRAGSIKPYDASYAAAIAAAPQLRVFGSDARGYGGVIGTQNSSRFGYVGSNYISWYGSDVFYAPTLALLSAQGAYTAVLMAPVKRLGFNGASHAVAPHSAAGNAPRYTADGAVWTPVGGDFAVFPTQKAICFGNNSWLSLASLNGIAGEQGYLAAANPSGTWTTGAASNIGMWDVNAIAYRLVNGTTPTFVAVGASSAGANAGKIATSFAVGGAWTDRTPAAGVTFGLDESILDVVDDGYKFVALTSAGRVLNSVDGLSWSAKAAPMDTATAGPFGIALTAPSPQELCTDGAGVVVVVNSSSYYGIRPVFSMSVDHGETWSSAQFYVGKTPLSGSAASRTISFANGKWIESHGGNGITFQDLGALVTPMFIGSQTQLSAGQFVRIK